MSRRALQLITTINHGGAERHLLSLVRGLVESGDWEVTLAYLFEIPEAPSLRADFQALGVSVVPIQMRSPLDLLALRRLYRLVRRGGFDLVHTHLFRSDWIGLPLARLAGVPVSLSTVHNVEPRYRGPWIEKGLHLCYRLADHVIAISEAVRQVLVERFRVPSDRVSVIHYGIETGKARSAFDYQTSLREHLRISPDALVIGTVGRLAEQKGHRYLIEAFAQIREEFPQARLVIVGHNEGNLREALETQIKQLALSDVVFLPGRWDGAAAIREFDLFAFPSLWEGFGLVLLEAMEAGKPIVASRVGPIPEIVEDGTTGILVPPADSRSLAAAIRQLIQDPELRRRLGENGRQRFYERFSWEQMVQKTQALYNQLVQRT